MFRLLSTADSELDLTVLFCQLPDERQQGDGFGIAFQWDVPLLDGYRYSVLRNVSRRPAVTAFRGCDTPEVWKLIRDGQFDAVITNGWIVKSCLQTLAACRRYGVPCLVRGEANLMPPRPWWKHLLHGCLVRQYSACLYIGQANAEFYRRHGVRESRLFPARYCVENRRFLQAAQDPTAAAAARARFGVPGSALCLLFCGKLIPKKHPVELIQAFGNAVRQGASAYLLVVGDGELRSDCERLALDQQLPMSCVGFLNQSQITEAYLAADCLVLPSDYGETWGLVVNEAMTCGRPAIVSDQVGCCADLIVEGETGASFPSGDWQALTRLIVAFSRTAEQVQAMGRNAQRHIAGYSPEAAAQGIRQAIDSVCGRSVKR